MNLWQCDAPGCKRTAIGSGGAIGLRAIGWFVRLGPVVFCPGHRPDHGPCEEHEGETCSLCPSEAEAKRFQDMIRSAGDKSDKLTNTVARPVAARATVNESILEASQVALAVIGEINADPDATAREAVGAAKVYVALTKLFAAREDK